MLSVFVKLSVCLPFLNFHVCLICSAHQHLRFFSDRWGTLGWISMAIWTDTQWRSLAGTKEISGQRDVVSLKSPVQKTYTSPLHLPVLRATLRTITLTHCANNVSNMSLPLRRRKKYRSWKSLNGKNAINQRGSIFPIQETWLHSQYWNL